MKTISKAEALALYGIDFDEVTFSKAAEIQPPNSPTDKSKAPLSEKLEQMVDAMLLAAPTLNRQAAHDFLTNTAHGRRLAEHLNNLSKGETVMPQVVDIMKLHNPDSVTEFIKSSGASEHVISEVIMGHAKLNKRSGESDAQAFARVFPKFQTAYGVSKGYSAETDDSFPSLTKRQGVPTLSLTPTSTSVGNTLVSDDSAEAIRLLNEMAEKQGRTFTDVFADPNNKALAGRTYTSAHRPNVSTAALHSGDEQ
jgi:hypothetical protein